LAATPDAETQPRYSPDGRWLALLRTTRPPKRIESGRILLVGLADLKSRELPVTAEENPSLIGWAKDKLLFSEGRGTRSVLYTIGVDGPAQVLFERTRGTF